jgi:hypothetical protein
MQKNPSNQINILQAQIEADGATLRRIQSDIETLQKQQKAVESAIRTKEVLARTLSNRLAACVLIATRRAKYPPISLPKPTKIEME